MENHSFTIPVDLIECRVFQSFQLTADVEPLRQAAWAALAKTNPAAFDGALLRLADYHQDPNGRLIISAESTSFSAYVATRHPTFEEDHPSAMRADPLGITAIVLTADDQVIVTVRSLEADQNPGALYLIGGYAEPGGGFGNVDVFREVAREIEEEIAVVDLVRSASYAIGLAYDSVFCHPELFMLTVSQSPAVDIVAKAANARDRNEAAQLFACPLHTFLDDEGSLTDRPQTWSFIKARQFLREHLVGSQG